MDQRSGENASDPKPPSGESIPKGRLGCLLLVVLVLASPGLFTLWLTLRATALNVMARTWDRVPATIVRAEFLGKLVKDPEGDSETANVKAEYRYKYQGQVYKGDRVTFYIGADSGLSFHRNIYRELKQHQTSGKPMLCYVNPRDPTQAVLYPGLRWEMICGYGVFTFVFCGIGVGLFLSSAAKLRGEKTAKAAAARHPTEPWLWKPDWARGEVHSNRSKWTTLAITAALLWNVPSLPLWVLLPTELAKKNYYALLGVLFLAVGAALAAWAIVLVLRGRKYGEPLLRMASVPGVIGGELAGVIYSRKVHPEKEFQLTLTCSVKTSEKGGDGETSEVVWQDQRLVTKDLLKADPDRTAIPVLFQIPFACRPTDEQNTNAAVTWRLAVRAKTPGIDYSASFDVPVFRTAGSDTQFATDPEALAEFTGSNDLELELDQVGIRSGGSEWGQGRRFDFPMGRAPIESLVVTGAGLAFAGSAAALIGKGPEALMAVAGLTALGVLLVAADMWFFRSTIDASPGGLKVSGGWFGMGRARMIAPRDVQKVESRQVTQSWRKLFFNLVVTPRDGRQFTAAKRIPSERLAKAIAGQIGEALKVKQQAAS